MLWQPVLAVWPQRPFLLLFRPSPLLITETVPEATSRKCPHIAPLLPESPCACLTIRRGGSVMWKKLFLKLYPLFYRENQSRKVWLPKHLPGNWGRLVSVLPNPGAAKSALCAGGPAGCRAEVDQMEHRVQQVQERQWHGGGQVPSSLRSHLHMFICFVTAVWFLPFQRVN